MIWARRATSAFLTLLAIVGLVGGALFVAVQTGHLQTFMFVSGSMHPTFDQGDAVVSRRVDAANLQVGDVVTVPLRDGVLVTHRIVAIDDAEGGARTLTLRGDANERNDPQRYTVSHAFVPAVRIPNGANVVLAIREPGVGIPLAGGAVGLIGLVMLTSSNEKPGREGGHAAPGSGSEGGAPEEPTGRRRALEIA